MAKRLLRHSYSFMVFTNIFVLLLYSHFSIKCFTIQKCCSNTTEHKWDKNNSFVNSRWYSLHHSFSFIRKYMEYMLLWSPWLQQTGCTSPFTWWWRLHNYQQNMVKWYQALILPTLDRIVWWNPWGWKTSTATSRWWASTVRAFANHQFSS